MISNKETTKKRCVAIVPAAGSSSRMKEYGNKLFMEMRGIPVIAITLRALENSTLIDEIIIPTRTDMIPEIEKICKKFSITKATSIIEGGATRAESVFNGVLAANGNFNLIAIHDAARPFISPEIIERTISAANEHGAAAPAVAMKDTIKSAKDGIVIETIPRETLFAIQTPQIFASEIIREALRKAIKENIPITDDCSAVEASGTPVFLTDGDYFNIKITTPEDLIFAEAILQSKNEVIL